MTIVKPLDAIATVCFLFVVIAMLPGCAVLEKLPPAQAYTMDSQQKCLEQHVWDQTVVGTGVTMDTCSAIAGWSQERKALDAKDAIANLTKEAGDE